MYKIGTIILLSILIIAIIFILIMIIVIQESSFFVGISSFILGAIFISVLFFIIDILNE